jgi:hypothetical protein
MKKGLVLIAIVIEVFTFLFINLNRKNKMNNQEIVNMFLLYSDSTSSEYISGNGLIKTRLEYYAKTLNEPIELILKKVSISEEEKKIQILLLYPNNKICIGRNIQLKNGVLTDQSIRIEKKFAEKQFLPPQCDNRYYHINDTTTKGIIDYCYLTTSDNYCFFINIKKSKTGADVNKIRGYCDKYWIYQCTSFVDRIMSGR